MGGRTRSIRFDVRNANIMLAGGVSSGVFRSTDGGTTWVKVSPNDQIHNVTSLAQDTRAGQEDTWYYGTGELEASTSLGDAGYKGFGIWKSTDNGVTWTALTATQTGTLEGGDNPFDFVHRIVVDPTNGTVYAAATDVIQRSTDGGTTWEQVLGIFNFDVYSDIAVTSTGRLYAAFDGTSDSDGVWTSTTGANGSWTKIAGTGSASTPAGWNTVDNYGRIVIAVAPSSENILYVLYDNKTVSDCAGTPAPEADFYKWNQTTTTWTNLSANLPDE
ncbi:MAG: sialidase family protein [Chitinophagales bacterium]